MEICKPFLSIWCKEYECIGIVRIINVMRVTKISSSGSVRHVPSDGIVIWHGTS